MKCKFLFFAQDSGSPATLAAIVRSFIANSEYGGNFSV
jgi:hypothetical protein